MTLLIGSLQLGLLYAVMVLGIYVSFRILNIPDLTTEGSFTLGLAVSCCFTLLGHPLLGIAAGTGAGALAGSFTGFLQTKLDIHPVLAGILTMSGLYSINMMILGGAPNVSLIGKNTVFTMTAAAMPSLHKDLSKLSIAFAAALFSALLLSLFFATRLGLCIRAAGDNEDMVRASSINAECTRMIALALSNGLIALCGALIAQYQSFGDINSGISMLVVGLASVIIGEVFLGRRSLKWGFLSAIVGSVIYRCIIAAATRADWFPAYMLKLSSAFIVLLALALPAIKNHIELHTIRQGGKNHG